MLIEKKIVCPQAKPKAGEGEEEWWHSEGEGEESDDNGDEGVYEGRDSVLADRKSADDEMDTIARTAEHSYFLRSLTQPESFPGPRPGPPGTGTAAVGGVETRGKHAVKAVCRCKWMIVSCQFSSHRASPLV